MSQPAEPKPAVIPYEADFAADVADIRHALRERSGGRDATHRYLTTVLELGGRIQVIVVGDIPVGYGAAVPVPGLPDIFDLRGGILPAWRHRGLGSQLLMQLLAELEASGARRIIYDVPHLATPTAKFLQRRGFSPEHEEWQMELDLRRGLPQLNLPPGCRLVTYERTTAIRSFHSLYERIFQQTAWYQPYSETEVDAALDEAADLLFYLELEEPIGLIWIHLLSNWVGEIEPVGITASHQGRGHGRQLLLAGLHRLAERGANLVRLGVWADNHAAVRLYQQLGFRQQSSRTYLAFDLPRSL